MQSWRRTLLGLALLAALPAHAQDVGSEERITRFSSDIQVARDGEMTVAETIAVIAQGDRIRHGIYRDFPTRYKDRLGNNVTVRFDVGTVTRDGAPEPYATERISNGVRVKIGDAKRFVSDGPHTYVVTYHTNRQVGFFERHDELYWNVTGNGWQFRIDAADARLTLPPGAVIDAARVSSYTGTAGSRVSSASARAIAPNIIAFSNDAPLAPGEGLTIAVPFNKGVVLPPSEAERRRDYILANAGPFVAVLGLLASLVYFFAVWWQYGRDPRKGTIIPLFAPPAGLSPEAVRYIHRMAYDRKSFAAALIAMAVKGYLRISENGGAYTLIRTGKSEAMSQLSNGERAMAAPLFAGGDSITLSQSNYAALQRAIAGLKSSLAREYEGNYFVSNLGWFIGGLAIMALTGITAAMLSENTDQSGVILTILSVWTVATGFLWHRAINTWRDLFAGNGSRVANFLGGILISIMSLVFLGALLAALFFMSGAVSLITAGALVIGGLAAYAFYFLLKAPTKAGAAIRDQIEGFALFLNTAEKDRLEILHPPAVTPEVFEKFLPYAIALDCENRWSRKFEAEAAAAGKGPGDGGGYVPAWYIGNSFHRLGAAGFANSIGSSIGSAAAAASSPPGSSSGSGGGGFSGGGGGGGGGGGW